MTEHLTPHQIRIRDLEDAIIEISELRAEAAVRAVDRLARSIYAARDEAERHLLAAHNTSDPMAVGRDETIAAARPRYRS